MAFGKLVFKLARLERKSKGVCTDTILSPSPIIDRILPSSLILSLLTFLHLVCIVTLKMIIEWSDLEYCCLPICFTGIMHGWHDGPTHYNIMGHWASAKARSRRYRQIYLSPFGVVSKV